MSSGSAVLSPAQILQFIRDGFVRIDQAFPRAVAEAACELLWRDTGCDPHDARTWTRPVVRLGLYDQAPFAQAAASPLLHAAFDQLVGVGRWAARNSLGTFPVRFPGMAGGPDGSPLRAIVDPGDTGWHIDPGFGMETAPDDFLTWRTNLASRGRALLMLFLFSDVGRHDAPTRLRVGSHRVIARRLAPAGDTGLSLRELAAHGFADTAGGREVQATGLAGTVYLCHPFLVHAAQPHRGTRPRFIAQPPLLPAGPAIGTGPDAVCWPVARAIQQALSEAPAERRRRIVVFR